MLPIWFPSVLFLLKHRVKIKIITMKTRHRGALEAQDQLQALGDTINLFHFHKVKLKLNYPDNKNITPDWFLM